MFKHLLVDLHAFEYEKPSIYSLVRKPLTNGIYYVGVTFRLVFKQTGNHNFQINNNYSTTIKMQKTITLAVAALLGIASASKVSQCAAGGAGYEHRLHRTRYDYEDIDDRDEDCLCQEFELLGRKVVTINLDDKCDLRKHERDGIFLQSGDLAIVTGS